VLVVEDDKVVRLALARILRLEGFAVLSAASLAEAYALLDGQDAVLLDLNLPDGLGTEVLARIKAHHPRTRVAVLTGAEFDVLDQAIQMGADQVMRKPIDLYSLLAWLRHGSGAATSERSPDVDLPAPPTR
jgi:DNA-binding response OmpR family regulator